MLRSGIETRAIALHSTVRVHFHSLENTTSFNPELQYFIMTNATARNTAAIAPIDTANLDAFTQSYIKTALWSSHDESDEYGGEPMGSNYSIDDIHPDTLKGMIEDCDRFQADHSELFENGYETAGHDFWLTRNGHGAGFWDGDYSDRVGTYLTEQSEKYREVDLYIGDDEMIHASCSGLKGAIA